MSKESPNTYIFTNVLQYAFAV